MSGHSPRQGLGSGSGSATDSILRSRGDRPKPGANMAGKSKLPAGYVPPGGARLTGVRTRSASADPPPPTTPTNTDRDELPDPFDFPTARAAVRAPPANDATEGASRTAAIEKALDSAEQALNNEQTTVMELNRLLQQQNDKIAMLQAGASIYGSASGSNGPPRKKKVVKKTTKKTPAPKVGDEKKKKSRKEIMAHVQALLDLYSASSGEDPPFPAARQGNPGDPAESSSSSDISLSSTDRRPGRRQPAGPSEPTCGRSSSSESAGEDSSSDMETSAVRRRLRKARAAFKNKKAEVKEDFETFHRHEAIRPTNRRYHHLLSYESYFLNKTSLAYPARLVDKAHKVNRALNGPFQGTKAFDGQDPLGIFGFLSTIKRACDSAGATHGQAFPLLSYRLAGDAKIAFVAACSTRDTRHRFEINTYGEAVNWLLQKYATPDLLNEAYAAIIAARQEQEEMPRTFADRLERMCGRLDGLIRRSDIVDTFVNGLHETIKGHVVTFQMTKSSLSLPEAVTAAQIYWNGAQKMKVDIRRQLRNTTTPMRASTVVDNPGYLAAAVTDPVPPRFARPERGNTTHQGLSPRSRSSSPRRPPAPSDICYNCQGTGHFMSECPAPRKERQRERSPTPINAVVADDRAQEAPRAQGN